LSAAKNTHPRFFAYTFGKNLRYAQDDKSEFSRTVNTTTNIIQYYDEHIYYYVVAGIKLTLYSHIAVSGTSEIRERGCRTFLSATAPLFHAVSRI